MDTPNVTDSEDLHSESSDLEFDYSSDEYCGVRMAREAEICSLISTQNF